MSLASLASLLGGAVLVASLAVEGVRRLSLRWGVLDVPTPRSAHDRPMPTLGGLGIAAPLLLWAIFIVWTAPASEPGLVGLVLGSALFGLLGLWDDLRDPPWWLRLGAQLAVALACCPLLGPAPALELPGMGGLDCGAWIFGLGALWLTGFSNLFNFLDGLDGLAAGLAVIVAATLSGLSFGAGAPLFATTEAMVAAACLGFLAHNRPPARIFMGNVGSSWLGYFLAASAWRVASMGTSLAPLALLFAPLLFDGVFTVARRSLQRQAPWVPHRAHLYQLLHRAGVAPWKVDLAAWLLGAGAAAMALAYPAASMPLRAALGVSLTVALGGAAVAVTRRARRAGVDS